MKYKPDVYKAGIVSLVGAGLSTAAPSIYGRLMDMILKNNINNQSFILLGVWLAIILSIIIINRYVVRKRHAIAVKCDRDLVTKASVHFIKMSVSRHKDKKIGEMFDKFTRAGSNLHMIVTQVVFTALPRFFAIAIISIILLLSVNYKLIFMISAIIAVYSLVTTVKTKPLETSEEEINKAFEDANGDIQDSISNIKAVKSFTAESEEEQKYLKGNKNIFGSFMPQIDRWSDLTSIQSCIIELGFFAIIGLSLMLFSQNEMTPGQIVMVIGYSRMIFEPLSNLSDNYILIRKGLVSIKGVETFLEEQEEDYQGGQILENVKGEVKFENVSFAYNGDQKTLKNISFTAHAGNMIALVGESGAGKSTLLELLLRFMELREGTILLDGKNISGINILSLREHIAVVPQDVLLFNETIEDNIRFGSPKASFEQVVRAAKLANADEFIQKISAGYQRLVGERGLKLSPGQRQRIAIARAILKDPKILILDEATSALDSITEKQVQDALKELVKGRTVFVIAHRLSTIKEANEILVIEDGEIVERGTHKKLAAIENGSYRRFLDLQTF